MAGRTEAFQLPQEGLLRGPHSKDRAQRQRGRLPRMLPSQGFSAPQASQELFCRLHKADWCTQHGPAKSGMTRGKHSERGHKMGTENE